MSLCFFFNIIIVYIITLKIDIEFTYLFAQWEISAHGKECLGHV